MKGKIALITGGTKGLGLETARVLAGRGAEIVLAYRSDVEAAERARATIEALGTPCDLIQADLSEDGAADRLFDEFQSRHQRLDYYIHNAAATAFKSLLEIKPHHVDKTFNITVKSFIGAVQRAKALMPSGSAIVTVSGMDTLKAVPMHGLLGAAKSSLETLTSYFAHELGPFGIRVNGVNPGFLATESTRKYLGPLFEATHAALIQATPLKREAKLSEVAQVIVFLCSEQASWIVGQTIQVDGGLDFSLPVISRNS